jgi:hypothetical protein
MNNTSYSNLSPQDLKLIDSLRKQQRRWPRMRWVVLANGFAFAILVADLGSQFGGFQVGFG